MQDPDVPPQAEENTNGAVVGVRQDELRVARWAATARSIRVSLLLPWTTATAPVRAAPTATIKDRGGPVFPRRTLWSIPSLCPLRGRTPLRATLPLSKTSSS